LLYFTESLRQCVTNATFNSRDLSFVISAVMIKHLHPFGRINPHSHASLYGKIRFSRRRPVFPVIWDGLAGMPRPDFVSWTFGSQEYLLTTVYLCVDSFQCGVKGLKVKLVKNRCQSTAEVLTDWLCVIVWCLVHVYVDCLISGRWYPELQR